MPCEGLCRYIYFLSIPYLKKALSKKIYTKRGSENAGTEFKIFQAEFLCSHYYFFQAFQGRNHLNNLWFLFQVGEILPEALLEWDIHSLRNRHTFDMAKMEKFLPGRAGGAFPRPSWAWNDFTEPTFPFATGYKTPALTVRAEFPIFPWDKIPGNAGRQNPRRLQVLQTSPEWFLLPHLDPGAGKSVDNSEKGPHSAPELFPGTFLGDGSLCTQKFVSLCASLVLWFYFCVREKKGDFFLKKINHWNHQGNCNLWEQKQFMKEDLQQVTRLWGNYSCRLWWGRWWDSGMGGMLWD